MIGYGWSVEWLNEQEFLVWRPSVTYKGSINRAGYERFSEDSIRAHPVRNGSHIVFEDLRRGCEGLWITTTSSFIASGTKEARQLYRGGVIAMAFSRNDLFFVAQRTGDLGRILLSDGKEYALKTKIPWLSSANDFTVSEDGDELVYIDSYWTSKFVVIDNLFN